MSAHVRSDRRGAGVLLTLDRPERRNALAVETVRQLADALVAATDDGARAIVVTGAPPAFCAGGDLDDLVGVADHGALAASDTIYGNFHRLARTIRTVPVPVVAAVNGAALGAGFDLALAADLRIAARDAVFASSWVAMGLVPGMGGAFVLPGLVGGTRAAQLLLLGERIDATRALGWGLVNDVVDGDALLARADELVEQVAALPAGGVGRTKAAYHRGVDAALDAELATLGATQGTLLTGDEFGAAVERFRRR